MRIQVLLLFLAGSLTSIEESSQDLTEARVDLTRTRWVAVRAQGGTWKMGNATLIAHDGDSRRWKVSAATVTIADSDHMEIDWVVNGDIRSLIVAQYDFKSGRVHTSTLPTGCKGTLRLIGSSLRLELSINTIFFGPGSKLLLTLQPSEGGQS
jgi:hypothetical protein